MSNVIVKCPNCGSDNDITDRAPWDIDETKEFDCEKCGKQFEVEAEYHFIRHHVVSICPSCGERERDCYCQAGRAEGRQG